MRTTIDLPDALFRRAKATAAARGVSLKQVITAAIEKEVVPAPPGRAKLDLSSLTLIHLEPGRILDPADFDFSFNDLFS